MSTYLDQHHYPTEEALEKIRRWEMTDPGGLFDFVCPLFRRHGTVILHANGEIHLATGGWSGNEDIIQAIHDNVMFWSNYWESTDRGGLYVFRFRSRPPAQGETK